MAVKLQFTEEELDDPKLQKSAHKAQRRTDKLEKAEKKLPKKTVRKPVRTVDPQTGKPRPSVSVQTSAWWETSTCPARSARLP